MFDVLDELEVAVDKTAAFEGPLDVERMFRLAERVEFLRLRAVRQFELSGEWQADGFASTAAALRAKCRVGHGSAQSSVVLARKLDALPVVAAAFGAGELSRPHAAAIAAAYTPKRAGELANVEAELVEFGKISLPRELAKVVRQLTDAIDGDGGAGNDEREYAKNRYTFDATLTGRFEPHGSFDPESGELQAAALSAEMAVLRRKGDTRLVPERRAEAMTSICRWYLAQHDTTSRAHAQPHLSVVVDLAGRIDGALLDEVIAEAAHGSRLSRVTLDRICCDAKITRILMNGPSQVLDVGRTTRTIPPHLWKTLVARDRGCTEPGCDRGPGFCEGHHIRHWEDGGPTNLENLRLLCWYHHLKQHLKDAQARPG